MHPTARSYLLAGFTATSIVAAMSAAPYPAAHLPGMQSPHVLLSATESDVAAKVRSFRNAEVRVAVSMIDRAATVVGSIAAQSNSADHEVNAIPGAKTAGSQRIS